MTDVETAPDEAPLMERAASGWIRWVSILAVVALVVGVAWFGWWLRHPDDLRWGGYGFGTERPAGEALWASVSDPPLRAEDRRVIRINGIEPVDLAGRGVRVDYFVCSLDPEVLDPRTSFGTGSGDDVRRSCRDLRAARGTTMDLVRDARQQVLVRVTATRPGVVRMTAHRVVFGEGWQRGTTEVGPELRIRTSR